MQLQNVSTHGIKKNEFFMGDRMNVKSYLMSGVAFAMGASVVQASDLPSKTAAPAASGKAASSHNWTGISIGFGGGGQFLQSNDYVNANAYADATYGDHYVNNGVDQTTNLAKLGGFGTAQIAVDYQASSMVLGAFADYDFGSAKAGSDNLNNSCYTDGSQYAPPQCSSGASVEIGNSWDVGARLGVLLNDRTLVYALGGYSWAKIKTFAYNNANNNLNGNDYAFSYGEASKSQTRGGLMLGAGFEYAFSDNVSLKTEYRHVDYGKIKVDQTYQNGNYYDYSDIYHESDVTVDSVRAVLSYKF